MDLSNPYVIISGLFISAIGAGLFMYGKKAVDLRCILAGVALCVIPYFIGSMALLWLVSAGVVGGLFAWIKYGG